MSLLLHDDGQAFWCSECHAVIPRTRSEPFPEHTCVTVPTPSAALSDAVIHEAICRASPKATLYRLTDAEAAPIVRVIVEQQVAALTAEVARLTQEVEDAGVAAVGARSEREMLSARLNEREAERNALRAALGRYGRHLASCASRETVQRDCSCGLGAALVGAASPGGTG